MFQNLISFDVNESFASIANPQGLWMKLSIYTLLHSDTVAQMVVQSNPLYLFSPLAKYTNECCPWALTVHMDTMNTCLIPL